MKHPIKIYFIATLTSFVIICAASGEMMLPVIVASVSYFPV